MSKNTEYNILLICEGENTEPSYFGSIRDIVIENKSIWTEGVNIVIKPTPKLDIIEVPQESPHKTRRTKRALLQPVAPIDRKEIEDEYRQEPVRFVREGQLELEEGNFNEVWVVFDFDNRQYTEAAFELSKVEVNGKYVNIAFSNISFEYWVLLHFEKINYNFEKSECREGNTILTCNSGIHGSDCFGVKCVGGYLRKNNYLQVSSKSKESLFPHLEKLLPIALYNASWLKREFQKSHAGNDEEKYWLGPYTNVDSLVKRLLQINEVIVWWDYDSVFEVHNIEVCFMKNGDNEIIISITNKRNQSIIVNANQIVLENNSHAIFEVGERRIINSGANSTFLINIDEANEFNPEFISVIIDNTKVICNL
ncbi:RloB family protein [Flagellimonas sp.]|uniref:RloB family protein n=1 Tax=Flagellimonas sp. TaxID=2058762 RepID=UPI003BB19A4E